MTRPNVLLVCVDHWPGPLLGAAGHEGILTPTLNRLADNGTLFSQAYSTTATCIPARRALMTGTRAETHGDRVFNEYLEMDPELPTLPQVFRDAGYQAYAVGKMHVYPQRDRVGFDEVILNEEGRHHLGGVRDDFELFLAEEGYAGQELTHFQLFDLEADPREIQDLAGDAAHAGVRNDLADLLAGHLYDSDLRWVRDGRLVGEPDKEFTAAPSRGLAAQRGWR